MRPLPRLDGIDDAQNLVVGPNELGKSTLFDALRAMALQNDRSGAAPVVEIVFDVDGMVRRYSATYGSAQAAERHAAFSSGDGMLVGSGSVPTEGPLI